MVSKRFTLYSKLLKDLRSLAVKKISFNSAFLETKELNFVIHLLMSNKTLIFNGSQFGKFHLKGT